MLSLTISLTSLIAFQTVIQAITQEIITETRNVSRFNAVTTSGPFVVDITFGTKEALTIEADSKILPYVETAVAGKTLNLRFVNDVQPRIRYTEPINIAVIARTLSTLISSGTGPISVSSVWKAKDIQLVGSGTANITVSTFNVNDIDAVLSGTGNIIASGVCRNVNITMNGFGSFYGRSLNAQKVNVALYSPANITIGVEKTLSAKIFGSGNVFYSGDPQVNEEIVGSGAVQNIGLFE